MNDKNLLVEGILNEGGYIYGIHKNTCINDHVFDYTDLYCIIYILKYNLRVHLKYFDGDLELEDFELVGEGDFEFDWEFVESIAKGLFWGINICNKLESDWLKDPKMLKWA